MILGKLKVQAEVVETNGHKALKVNNINYFRHHLRKFNGPVTVTIEKKQSQRSLSQNALYWGVDLPIIAEHTGHTPEELHEIFKRLFLPRKQIKYRGKMITVPGSSAELTKGGWIEYRMRYQAEVATMGITLPDPNERDIAPML